MASSKVGNLETGFCTKVFLNANKNEYVMKFSYSYDESGLNWIQMITSDGDIY